MESDEPDVVETIETDRRTREVLALVPKLLSGRERYIIETGTVSMPVTDDTA